MMPLALLAAACFVFAAIAASKAQIPEGSFGRGTPLSPVAMSGECPGLVLATGVLSGADFGAFAIGDERVTVFQLDPQSHQVDAVGEQAGAEVELVLHVTKPKRELQRLKR